MNRYLTFFRILSDRFVQNDPKNVLEGFVFFNFLLKIWYFYGGIIPKNKISGIIYIGKMQ